MSTEHEDKAYHNPLLKEQVASETEVKSWLVEYVGAQCEPEDSNVTVEMIVETVAKEFPEFLMVVAEENFMRGYEQALNDVESYNQVIKEHDQMLAKPAADDDE
tara:strand:- start:1901 stop:2212 length:312 start_codon:yes stop_codon:yes gene_type:complete